MPVSTQQVMIDVGDLESHLPEGYGWLVRSDEQYGYFVNIFPSFELPIVGHGFISPTYKAYGRTIEVAIQAALSQIPAK